MNKIIKVIIVFLTIIEIVSLYLAYKSYNTFNESRIEEIKVNSINDLNTSSSFAVLVEGNNGVYSENNDRTQWPNSSEYYYYDTECYDELGVKVDANASYLDTTHTYTLTTKKSLFCYIKFAKKSAAVNTIITNAGTQLETVAHMKARGDNIRRFQGQTTSVANNYICLGTSDSTTCTGDTDKYMYRIIGIVSEVNNTTNEQTNQLKVIKRTPLSSRYQWHSTTGSQYTWGYPADLNTEINGDYFLTNTTYKLDSQVGNNAAKNWKDHVIAPHTWQYGDVPYDNSTGIYETKTGKEVFDIERQKWTNGENKGTSANKIGLMYTFDYILATEDGENKKCVNSSSSDYGTCRQNWIHPNQNGSSELDWTMSRSNGSYAWLVTGSGAVYYYYKLNDRYSVRPVFYLQSTIQLKEGTTGTIDNPYIITNV